MAILLLTSLIKSKSKLITLLSTSLPVTNFFYLLDTTTLTLKFEGLIPGLSQSHRAWHRLRS